MIRQKKIIQLLIFIYGLVFQSLFSQIVDPVKIMPLDSDLIITEQITSYLLKYKFILVGELHGTQEPVKFVTQLAKRLAMSKKVVVGFEIGADEIGLKTQRINASQLALTTAFTVPSAGRNSQAWFNAIVELSERRGIPVFFFDQTDAQKNLNRDSVMCNTIREKFMEDTNCIVITISGNYHNQLTRQSTITPMGFFLNELFPGQVLAVNQQYAYGSMFNKTTGGLASRTIKSDSNVLSTISTAPAYFYPDPLHEFSTRWNAFLFTTKINASFPIKNE